MRRNLLIALIAGAGGAAAAALIGVATVPVVGEDADERRWLIGISAGLGAFAGASIGWICAATHARTGVRPTKALAAVAIGFLAGILIARQAFGSRPGGMQLLLAIVGAVVGSLVLRLATPTPPPGSAAQAGPRSRRFQFTLATLLAALTLISVFLAMYARGPIRRHQVATAIERSGGHVGYGTRAPYWVVGLLGDVSRGFLNTVVEVRMRSASNSDLAQLSVFSDLRVLTIEGGRVTDDGLRFLSELHALEELDLGGLQLSDAALEHLQTLERLRSLSVPSGTTGRGLAKLAPLTNLERLWIYQGRLGVDDFRHLKQLTQLRELSLWQTTITDKHLEPIGELASLEVLRLYRQTISDDGLAHLRRLTRLKELNLAGSNITDAGLEHLRAMARLEVLDLSSDRFTGAGFAAIDTLGQLRRLELGGSPVTDKGLESIGRLTSLQDLGLGRTKVTDDGLASLGELKKLYRLGLSGNAAISDAGLVHLEPLANMMYLETAGSAVTSAGLARLNREWEQRRLEAANSTKREVLPETQLP